MRNLFFCLLICFWQIAAAQSSHIEGSVMLDLQRKTLTCEWTYSNLPERFALALNRDFGKPVVKDESGNIIQLKRLKDKGKTTEARQYALTPGTYQRLYITYKGKPGLINRIVAKNIADWKGNIAFNGYSLRASEQSAWYPLLYDTEQDKLYDNFTYRVDLQCNECKSIYLNGAPPQRGPSGVFASETAVPLLLYAGQFDFRQRGENYYINSPLSEKQEIILNEHTEKVKRFYELKLNIPYGSAITHLATTPTQKNKAWLFVSYPTIVQVGNDRKGMAGLFRESAEDSIQLTRISNINHEIGHYYFGNVLMPNDVLFWVFLEGFTQYMSLQAGKELLGLGLYDAWIDYYITQAEKQLFKPLHQITKHDEVDVRYRYYYIPLLLTAIEKEIGADMMWRWIEIILQSGQDVKTDYAFFQKTLMAAGLDAAQYETIAQQYIMSATAQRNVLAKVQQK